MVSVKGKSEFISPANISVACAVNETMPEELGMKGAEGLIPVLKLLAV